MKLLTKSSYFLLIFVLIIVIKLVFFEPEFNQDYAYEVAKAKISNMAKQYKFNKDMFLEPTSVGGNIDSGFLFTWDFISQTDGSTLSILVGISELTDSFSGTPFILDCRDFKNSTPYHRGFSHLCIE